MEWKSKYKVISDHFGQFIIIERSSGDSLRGERFGRYESRALAEEKAKDIYFHEIFEKSVLNVRTKKVR